MSTMEWKVAVGPDHVTAVYESGTAGDDAALFVCAHGAGGSMSDKGMLATAAALRSAGVGVVRFNFVYKEKGDRRPDFMPKLMDTVTAVVERVRSELRSLPESRTDRLLIGGRSMGGRAASMLAARGFEAAGLLLLAYPLHPAGKPEQAPRRASAADPDAGAVLQRNARPALHPGAHGARPHDGDRALADGMGRRRGPQLPRPQVVRTYRRRGDGRDRGRQPGVGRSNSRVKVETAGGPEPVPSSCLKYT